MSHLKEYEYEEEEEEEEEAAETRPVQPEKIDLI